MSERDVGERASKFATALIGVAVVLSGCSKEQQIALKAEAAKSKADYHAEVATVMRQVQPYVTERDLAACRHALETAAGLGAAYKVTSPLAPHIGYSCYVQGRDRNSLFANARPGIGYMARLAKVGHGIGGDNEIGFCGFILDGKQVKLQTWQKNTSTYGNNACAGLS